MGRSLGLEICQKMEIKSMKLTMWRVVVVLNMHMKFREKYYVGKMKQTIFLET